MDEFPHSDEEYDFVETNSYESSSKISEKKINEEELTETATQKLTTISKDIPSGVPPESQRNGVSDSVESIRKRTYEELISDFGDLFEDDNFAICNDGREKRPRWDEPDAVIKLILEERKKQRGKEDRSTTVAKSFGSGSMKDCVSTRIPSWNFVAVTRSTDSQRIYVRVQEKKRKNTEQSHGPVSGLLSVSYSQMKAEAEEIMVKNAERASLPASVALSKKNDDQLWVDKYRPRSYMELLSDESVNRSFLSWIKLWDKIVFNRQVVRRKKKEPPPTFGSKKFFRDKQEIEGLDAKGFPTHRIALLSGPPGLGKTTLAHLVARHAGYNVVEINASDDRGPEAFRQALLSSTEMRSLMGADSRPNCLILDEVDGAPAASIDLLIKFVHGKLSAKGRKSKDGETKKNEGCKRPIICICNEAYAPSLRALRAMAYIIPVPKVSAARLADRLATIAREEHLRADREALLQLAERSGCDVRSCLCALQYMGEACIDANSSLGLKDARRGLFECWKDILQVPMARGGPLSARERVQLVLKAAQSGETERLAQGVFQNYPENVPPKMDIVSKSLEWFQLYDKITTLVMSRQDWRVMPYTNYAFVAWHFGFASAQSVKLSFPYAAAEVNQKLNKSKAMLTATKRSYGRDIQTLALDIAPFLFELLNPRLRSVTGHLYSRKERDDLDRLVNVTLDLGLTLVQVKDEKGNLDYVLDPNLFEIGNFPDCKIRRDMPYAVKQIVAQELEIQRLKRAAIAIGSYQEDSAVGSGEASIKPTKDIEKNDEPSFKPAAPTVPNHLRQLEPMPLKASKFRNFFENFVPQEKPNKQKSPGTSPRAPKSIHRVRQILTKYGVWYKYKEGFSNSVRRDVKISDLL